MAIFSRDAFLGALPWQDFAVVCSWRPSVARYRSDAFLSGNPWQLFRFMHPKSALGRKKRPFLAASRRHVSKMSWLWQDMRAMYAKSPANRLSGMHSAKILPGRAPFRCTDPSNHARRANLAIPRCFVWVLRVGWGRSGARGGVPASARGLCAATPLCARRRHRANVSAGSPAPSRSCARRRGNFGVQLRAVPAHAHDVLVAAPALA